MNYLNNGSFKNGPQPSLEWVVTELCNYSCPYCCFEGKNGHCSGETMEATYRLLSELEGSWLVKLVGGEPMIHPRFFEICEEVTGRGHRLCMTTNFSLPLKKLERLVDSCGDKLDYVTASMHLDQIDHIDDFVEKAVSFVSMKAAETDFTVTSVVKEDNFEQLKRVEERLTNNGVHTEFQIMKIKGQYVCYNEEIEGYISGKLIRNTETLRGGRLFGTFCHTGRLFFKINVNGEAVRCYSQQPYFYLGNVKNDFKRYESIKPCLAKQCTCTVPVNRHMICFGEKASAPVMAKTYVMGLVRDLFRLAKNIRA